MKEKSTSVKLFSTLLAVQTASLLLSLMEGMFGGGELLQWVQKGLTAVMIVCLLSLSREHRFFRWSGICWAAVLGITLVDSLLSTPEMLTDPKYMWIFTALYWLQLAASYPATILEYLAYGKAVPALRKRWTVFLIVNFIWVQLGNAVSNLAVQQYKAQAWSAQTVYTLAQSFQIINLVFQIVYLWFLSETYQAVRKRTEK